MRRTALCLAPVAALTIGCGGSSAPTASGRATLTIVWPSASRLIPAAANGIRIVLKQDATVIGERLVARPSSGVSTVFFDRLPGGAATATATAFPNADGTGVALAAATVPITLTLGQNTDFAVTMASTIDHLELTIPTSPMAAGATGSATVTARDASGAAVLLTPAKLDWISTSPSVASIDSSGGITALSMGSTTLRVSDTESLRVVQATLSVIPRIVLSPTDATLSVSETKAFTATVTGASDTRVTWSVDEGVSGGSVTTAGVYTAPSVAGTYHLTAASVADPNQKATATITVQSGGLSGTID